MLREFRFAEDALVAALTDVQTWQNTNPGKPLPADKRQALKRATDIYTNDNQGPTMREMLRRHLELQRRRGSAWLSDAQDLFDANFNTQGNFGNVDFYPRYETWLDTTRSWTKISATSKDLEKQTHNSQTSFSGGLGLSWGLFRIGGSYEKDETLQFQQAKTSNLNISFEVLQVPLRYPWLTFGLFESGAWNWSRNSQYKDKLSDGVYNPELAGTPGKNEILPWMPTSLIVVRNLTLSADWGFDMNQFLHQHEAAGGSIGWGPFSIGGRSESTDERTYTVAKATGTTITFSDPQIIGYYTYMLPDSPHPDPSLPWPNSGRLLTQRRMSTDPLVDRAQKALQSK